MKKQLALLGVVLVIGLTGCGNTSNKPEKANTNTAATEQKEMNHMDMEHSGSGEVPEGIVEAKNPTYKVGSEVVLKTAHMEGMDGAKATVAGAYDTIAYVISYTPTDGGAKVSNHKWVIQEEIENAGDTPLKPGSEVTIMADHMKGMKGATATIDSAEKTTVYMVNYIPTTGGEEVKNHKWVTESEMTAK